MFRPEIRRQKVYCGQIYFGTTRSGYPNYREIVMLRYCNLSINHDGDCGYEAPTEEHIIKGEN